MDDDEMAYTTIRIKPITRARLDKHGLYGDTLDDILNKVLDQVEKQKAK